MKKTVKNVDIKEEHDELEPRVYEIGFHIVPDMDEAEAQKEFDAVKAVIVKEGGEIISEIHPTLRVLAYSISKVVRAVKTNYHKAYFSSIKFEVAPEAIAALKTSMDANEKVIRYLTVQADRNESVVITNDQVVAEDSEEEVEVATEEAKTEEVEKEIDALVIE